MNSGVPIRIATRDSRLARWQAEYVAGLLRAVASDRPIEFVLVKTVGDRDQRQALSQIGGTGVFTREIQNAVLDGRADVAVHSLKDLPTEPVEGLTLAAVPERGPRSDVLVLPQSAHASGFRLDDLPAHARLGTGRLRRRAQLLHWRPDSEFHDVRGNVETRVHNLDDGQFDALVLAEAGLRRLGLDQRISAMLVPPTMYPAVGQGAIGIECRSDDAELLSTLARIIHPPTFQSVIAERSLLSALRAGCHAPVGVTTNWRGDALSLEAVVLSPDGRQRLVASATSAGAEAVALGRKVAEALQSQGADSLISASRPADS